MKCASKTKNEFITVLSPILLYKIKHRIIYERYSFDVTQTKKKLCEEVAKVDPVVSLFIYIIYIDMYIYIHLHIFISPVGKRYLLTDHVFLRMFQSFTTPWENCKYNPPMARAELYPARGKLWRETGLTPSHPLLFKNTVIPHIFTRVGNIHASFFNSDK